MGQEGKPNLYLESVSEYSVFLYLKGLLVSRLQSKVEVGDGVCVCVCGE